MYVCGRGVGGRKIGGRHHGCGGRQVEVQLALRGGSGLQRKRADVDGIQSGGAVGDDAWRAPRQVVTHQLEAGGIDEIALGVPHERPSAREKGLSAAVGDDEETVAFDGEIGGGRRELEGALLGDGVAEARFHAAGHVLRRAALQDERGEFRRRALVAGGAGVGDVVGDRTQPVGLCRHSGRTRPHHTIDTHRACLCALCSKMRE